MVVITFSSELHCIYINDYITYMAQEEFYRLQALRSEIEQNPTKMTLSLPDIRLLMNNFHHRLIGYMAKPAPGDDEIMRKIIEEHSRKKICDICSKSSKEEYSDRLWNMTPAEHYQDVRTAIEAVGLDPDVLENEIRQYSDCKKPDELLEKMLVVYQHLRSQGYTHRELTT